MTPATPCSTTKRRVHYIRACIRELPLARDMTHFTPLGPGRLPPGGARMSWPWPGRVSPPSTTQRSLAHAGRGGYTGFPDRSNCVPGADACRVPGPAQWLAGNSVWLLPYPTPPPALRGPPGAAGHSPGTPAPGALVPWPAPHAPAV